MNFRDLLLDSFARIRAAYDDVLDGITDEQLEYRSDADANSIAWLCWHLTRIQDDHIAGAAGLPQVWTSQGWQERFGLPLPPEDHGYGHGSEQVAVVKASAELLAGYHVAVHAQTVTVITALTEADLERIVDESWDPPVTFGVRLVSVIADDLQHTGQAAFVRGLAERS
jgi:uncharacterized damage-inducible protein DinB